MFRPKAAPVAVRGPFAAFLPTAICASLLTASPFHVRADEAPLAAYFKSETAKLAARPLLGIASAEEWQTRRPELQRQLREMLGLDPLPERTDLAAKVTGVVDRPDFVVEKVLYQSRPGLYVTGNLYRPKEFKAPLPAILYVCGHSDVKRNGIIYGNKTHYQHHAAWYAANGYICLVVDTLQLGELPGLHHGTYREGRWWWQSRGYTPAGVEAWNGIRGIDYLVSRPDVDPSKIGVTGRSGGGATTWWIAALDDRVTAAVAVAGITDLTNHVVDGVIEGHCDCMFTLNTYRWDYATVAALVAPKPLLVENTDKDPIFPEDGVRRVYAQIAKVYAWYGAGDRLGLVIGQGGHVDSTEVRHPSFGFFDKWLKGRSAPIVEPDRSVPIEELKVLGREETPPGNQNATIQETFVATAPAPAVPETRTELKALQDRWTSDLRTKVFAGWPQDGQTVPLAPEQTRDETQGNVRLRSFDFDSQEGVRLTLWIVTHQPGDRPRAPVVVAVIGEPEWRADWARLTAKEKTPIDRTTGPASAYFRAFHEGRHDLVLVAPRGVGPTAWDPKKETQIRRRFALLGQTVDGMRVWDVRRALAALRTIADLQGRDLRLAGRRDAAALALWAAVFEPGVASVALDEPPHSVRDAPALLNVARVMEIPQALALLYPRAVEITDRTSDAWLWAESLGRTMRAADRWPTIVPVDSTPRR